MRRILMVATMVIAAALSGVMLIRPAAAGSAVSAVSAVSAAPGVTIDGVRVGHLPPELGRASDFRYEYDDVAFVSRVWESRTQEGWRVDMTVDVLRGAVLSDRAALRDWLIEYQERPAGEAVYVPTTVGSGSREVKAWIGVDQVFWLLRPGVAVLIHLDTSRWPHRELYRIADSVRRT